MTARVAALHRLGATILSCVVQKQTSGTARIVLPQLTNRIVVHGASPQYTAALAMIVKVEDAWTLVSMKSCCLYCEAVILRKIFYSDPSDPRIRTLTFRIEILLIFSYC